MTFWVYLETLARAASAAGPAHGPEERPQKKRVGSQGQGVPEGSQAGPGLSGGFAKPSMGGWGEADRIVPNASRQEAYEDLKTENSRDASFDFD